MADKKKARTKSVKTHAYSTPKALAVKGTDQNKAYRFVRKDDTSIGMREQAGWEVVKDENIVGPGTRGASTRETHDLILMEMPKDMHDEIKKIPGLRSKQRMEAAPRQGGNGIEEFEKTKITNDHLQDGDNSDIIFE